MFNTIIHWLFILFHPPFWIMNYPYSEEWEEEFIKLIDSNDFTEIDQYEAMLGSEKIWIANYPYAAFKKHISGRDNPFIDNPVVRPSRWTIYQARKKLKRDWDKQVSSCMVKEVSSESIN